MHDDIGDFFEVDTEEVYEFLWFHIFRYTRKSCDIRKEACDSFSCSSKFYFLVIIKNIEHQIFCEILWKGVFEKAFSFLFIDVFVEGCTYCDSKNYKKEFDWKIK